MSTRTKCQNKEAVNEFLNDLKKYDLHATEKLELLNTLPKTLVEVINI